MNNIIGAALLVAVVGMACLGAQATATSPGITDDQILFGQSAVFSGPSQDLGREMRLGIKAAFHEANQAGGVHGRELALKTLDDSYETDYAFHTTKWLIEKAQVFALIGEVGTPTSRVASPVAHDAGVPFLAPFTGAEFLRDPALDNVVNLRASYYQETEEMIARLTEDLGVTRVGVFYQDDSFGTNGLEGVRRALERRGLEPVGSWRLPAEFRRGATGSVRHRCSQPRSGRHDWRPGSGRHGDRIGAPRHRPGVYDGILRGWRRPGQGVGRRWARRVYHPGGAVPQGRRHPGGRQVSSGPVGLRPAGGTGVRFLGGIPGRTPRHLRPGDLRTRDQPRMLHRISPHHRKSSTWAAFASNTAPATTRDRTRCF